MFKALSRFIPCLLLLLPLACSKDDPEQKVQPALESARALHHMSKMWEMMYLTIGGQASAILPDGMRLTWVDSTLADWDGMEFYLDFGKRTKAHPWGKLCRDGYYRSGIYRVSLGGDAWVSGLYMALIMQGKDSCTLSNAKNVYRFEGRMHIQVKQDQQSTIQAAFSTTSEATKTWLESDATLQLMPPDGTTYPPYTLVGNGSVRSDYWQMLWDSKNLVKTTEETGSFAKGTLQVWGGKEEYRVDFDPYGNEAFDLWLKIWKGRSEFLFVLD